MISEADLDRTDIDINAYLQVSGLITGNGGYQLVEEAMTEDRRHALRWVTAVYAIPAESDFRIVQISFSPDACSARYVIARTVETVELQTTRGTAQFTTCAIPDYLLQPLNMFRHQRDGSNFTISHDAFRMLTWGQGQTKCGSIPQPDTDFRLWNEFLRLGFFVRHVEGN